MKRPAYELLSMANALEQALVEYQEQTDYGDEAQRADAELASVALADVRKAQRSIRKMEPTRKAAA